MARKRLILLNVLCLLVLQAYLVAEVKELQDGELAKSQTAAQAPADLSLQTNPNAPGPLVISTLDDGTSVIGQGEVDLADGPALNPNLLTATEVDAIVQAAVQAAVQAVDRDGFSVVITDRSGRILAAWETPGSTLEHGEWALSLARTGAFFSNDQAPLYSRTVRFISGIHFPPGIPFQPNGALYGIESSNRDCSLNAEFNSGKFLPPAKSLQSFLRETGITEGSPRSCDALDVGGCGVGVTTGKYVGIFEDGRLSEVAVEEILDQNLSQVHGGVGGSSGVWLRTTALRAFSWSNFLDGIRLPFVEQVSQPAGTQPGPLRGDYLVEPRAGTSAPEGWLVGGPENPKGSPELSSQEVERIVQQARDQANRTRASIRLPLGSRTRMVIAVGDLNGNLLALFRMPDSTVFSVDVAVAKSRNVVYFSSDRLDPTDLPGVPAGTAVTNRTIGFGSQPLFPVGIEFTAPGPFFDLFVRDLADPCSQGLDSQNLSNLNGIVFFPGSAPLYKNGKLVGGLGVSGDGVEQDDVVTDAGSQGFEATPSIRADQLSIEGVRLPYLKFNRNPEF